MKRIDELNFRYLKWNSVYYFANRLFARIAKPRSLPVTLIFVYVVHLIYYVQQNDFQFENQLVLKSFLALLINIFYFGLLYLFVYLFLGVLRETANASFVSRFMEDNGLKPYAKRLGWWTADTKITKDIVEKLPPSVRKHKDFRPLPAYSFDIKTRGGLDVSLSQFVYSFPMYIQSDFYFLALRLPYKKRTQASGVYLDNYRNGRSIMRLLKRRALDLEGNFSEQFRLYHLKEDAVAAREYLPPDVMELLLYEKTAFDYEFADGYVWIIAKGYHMNEQDLRRLCSMADKLYKE